MCYIGTEVVNGILGVFGDFYAIDKSSHTTAHPFTNVNTAGGTRRAHCR